MYSIGIIFRHTVVIITTIHFHVFCTREVFTFHLVWHLYTVQCSDHRNFNNNSYIVWYTVQNDTCSFSLFTCMWIYSKFMQCVLHVDVDRETFCLILLRLILFSLQSHSRLLTMHRLFVRLNVTKEPTKQNPYSSSVSRISIWYCSEIVKATSFGCGVFLWPHGGTDEWASEHCWAQSLFCLL